MWSLAGSEKIRFLLVHLKLFCHSEVCTFNVLQLSTSTCMEPNTCRFQTDAVVAGACWYSDFV